jgi:hypothetical protein
MVYNSNSCWVYGRYIYSIRGGCRPTNTTANTPLINQVLPSPSVPGSTQQEQFRRVFEEVWDETSGFDQLGDS